MRRSVMQAREESVILATALPVFARLYLAASDAQHKTDALLLAGITLVSCVLEKCDLPLSLKRNSSAGLFYGFSLVAAILLEISMHNQLLSVTDYSVGNLCRNQIKVSMWLILYLCLAWRFRNGTAVVEQDIQSIAYFCISGLIMHFLFLLPVTLPIAMHVIASLISVKMVSSYLPNCFTCGELFLFINLTVPLLSNYSALYSYIEAALVTNWVLFFVVLFLFSLSLPAMFGLSMSVWFFYSSGIMLLLCLLYVLFNFLPGGFLLWIIEFASMNSPTRQWLLAAWVLEIFACAIYVTCYRSAAAKSTTIERKFFHLFILVTFIPGLLYDLPMLFFCSVGATCILAILEAMRVFEMPPFSEILEERFTIFLDPQDKGCLILTPIYLILGQSLPIWAACFQDPTLLTAHKTMLPLAAYSAILSVGVGDTAASIIGYKFGTHKWPGTNKTAEGTAAAMVSQWVFIFFVIGKCNTSSLLIAFVASTAVSLIEAFTYQIDNIILPVYMYFLLNATEI